MSGNALSVSNLRRPHFVPVSLCLRGSHNGDKMGTHSLDGAFSLARSIGLGARAATPTSRHDSAAGAHARSPHP